MKATFVKLFTVAMCSAAVLTVQAIPVTGNIYFIGGVYLNDSLANATEFTGYSGPGGFGSNPVVLGGTQSGSYSSVPGGTAATWTSFAFNPNPGSVNPLWTFIVAGITYSFNATSVVVNEQTSTFLNIVGSGMAHIDGYDDAVGTWSITATGESSTFTFGAATTIPSPSPSVPDGGTTATLLGVALSGLAILKRRLS